MLAAFLFFFKMSHLISDILGLIAPKTCAVCGCRISQTDAFLCEVCNLTLPRTRHIYAPYDNQLAKNFWARIPIERAAALFYYEPGAPVSRMIQQLKYFHHPEIGEALGRFTAVEFQQTDFFEGIDAIVPIPLAPERKRKRGYNQSEEIAKGIAQVIHCPVLTHLVSRLTFKESQTHKGRQQRSENVENAFRLNDAVSMEGKHILLVDDIVTTGATIAACGRELARVEGLKISVCALGYTKE